MPTAWWTPGQRMWRKLESLGEGGACTLHCCFNYFEVERTESGCPTLAKALQFSPHPLPWGPPGCGHCRVFLPQKLLGLFRFMSGLLSPSLLSANQRLLLLHSVPCLINTHIPNTFSHTTAITKNLLLHTDNCFKSSSLGEKNIHTLDTFAKIQ